MGKQEGFLAIALARDADRHRFAGGRVRNAFHLHSARPRAAGDTIFNFDPSAVLLVTVSKRRPGRSPCRFAGHSLGFVSSNDRGRRDP